MKEEGEERNFSVYQADTNYEAARKMVQNLKFTEEQIPYWAAFIEEQRLKLNLEQFSYNGSPGSNHHHIG